MGFATRRGQLDLFLPLLEACAARLRVHQASFDNFQFTIRHKNIASSMLIEPQIDLITAIFH